MMLHFTWRRTGATPFVEVVRESLFYYLKTYQFSLIFFTCVHSCHTEVSTKYLFILKQKFWWTELDNQKPQISVISLWFKMFLFMKYVYSSYAKVNILGNFLSYLVIMCGISYISILTLSGFFSCVLFLY